MTRADQSFTLLLSDNYWWDESRSDYCQPLQYVRIPPQQITHPQHIPPPSTPNPPSPPPRRRLPLFFNPSSSSAGAYDRTDRCTIVDGGGVDGGVTSPCGMNVGNPTSTHSIMYIDTISFIPRTEIVTLPYCLMIRRPVASSPDTEP